MDNSVYPMPMPMPRSRVNAVSSRLSRWTPSYPYCIRGHTQAASKAGATEQEFMEAIWVAAEMRAGAVYTHSTPSQSDLNKSLVFWPLAFRFLSCISHFE